MFIEEFRDAVCHLDGDAELFVQSSLEDGDDNCFPVSDVEFVYGEDGSVMIRLLYNEEMVTATSEANGDLSNI
jgi:hypothetical protein